MCQHYAVHSDDHLRNRLEVIFSVSIGNSFFFNRGCKLNCFKMDSKINRPIKISNGDVRHAKTRQSETKSRSPATFITNNAPPPPRCDLTPKIYSQITSKRSLPLYLLALSERHVLQSIEHVSKSKTQNQISSITGEGDTLNMTTCLLPNTMPLTKKNSKKKE